MQDQDKSSELAAQVHARRLPASSHCGWSVNDSKAFYGHPVTPSCCRWRHTAASSAMSRLNWSSRARRHPGKAEIEAALAANGQMLAFEPPDFAGQASHGRRGRQWIGRSTQALGRRTARPAAGCHPARRPGSYPEVRRRSNEERGRIRPVTADGGRTGHLGALLELSIKVLPAPKVERSLVLTVARDRALQLMRDLARQPAPLSAACHLEDRLYIRLSGNASVAAWEKQIGGDGGAGNDFWSKAAQPQA